RLTILEPGAQSTRLLTSCFPIPKRLDENKCKCLIFLALPRELNPCFSLERAASSPLDEDPDKHLIEMPSLLRLGPVSSKVSCDRRSEVSHPAAHRLIGHHDAALSQQVLDIPEAEDKPGIEPDGLLNNRGCEAISGVADFAHDRHLWPQISAGKRNNVTMPWLAPPGQKADKALTSVSLSEQGLVQVLEAA